MSPAFIDRQPFSVGLTGGIGCGKSLVADLFAQSGAAIIDTDQIAHQLTAANGSAMPAINAEFGSAFLNSDGAMNRAAMRTLIFSDASAKARLEAILHPLIGSESTRLAQQARGDYLIFVVPLLLETASWRQRVNRILVVDCSEAQQLERVMHRNQLDANQVHAIMATQSSRATRLAAADDVIHNQTSPADLTSQVERLHALYLTLAASIRADS